ncbi:10149_t:CDS:1, partial [Ambispora leptoticha]
NSQAGESQMGLGLRTSHSVLSNLVMALHQLSLLVLGPNFIYSLATFY